MEEKKMKELEKRYDETYSSNRSFCDKVERVIKDILIAKSIPFHSINSRVKDKDSYLKKCDNPKYKEPEKEVMDLNGIRIITFTNSDVDDISNIIENEFDIDTSHSENKAEKMNENEVGYLSVHFIAKLNDYRSKLAENLSYKNFSCEIQVRTLLQNAWAEIEHDRNYKFSGELPKEIKRRFFLTAGMLEMLDREFQNLSDKIDKYSEKVKEKTKKGDLRIAIDSTSLHEYLLERFKVGWIEPTFNEVDKIVIEELLDFGIKELKDIESIIPDEFEDKYHSFYMKKKGYIKTTNFADLLRMIMIIDDHKKYFDKCWKEHWRSSEDREYDIYEYFGVPFNEIRETYDLDWERHE